MKVVHYIPSIDRNSGGVGSYMQLLARELGRLCELHIITHKDSNMYIIDNSNIHFISKSHNPFSNKNKRVFLDLLEQIKPDIVHVNCCWEPFCSKIALWSKKQHYNVVYTPHGMLEPWILRRHYWTKKLPALLLYQRKAIRNADVIHATAQSEKGNLLKLGYNKNIVVIPNGIDVNSIEMKKSWTRRKKILFLSRIHVKKGINFLIEAVVALKKEMNGYKVLIAGEGDLGYIQKLKEQTNNLGVANIIQFIGGVYGEKKWELYREADYFILPTHSENFGIVVAEALASGTPVITTDGTPWEELNKYRCGWCTKIGTEPTIEALRDAIHSSDEFREYMGRNGRKLVEEKYSAKKVAEEMVRMYSQL